MGYMKVIESDTTWECPKTGSYKIICVAGGQGGRSETGVQSNGGSTSFGGYLTASGCWGGTAHTGSTSIIYPGRNGYTFLNYADNNLDFKWRDSNCYSSLDSVGYGSGGYGAYSGGCGKLKMTIVTLNEGDTISCIIGQGGSGDTSSGKAGVIVVQYLGDDGWAASSADTLKRVTVNLYAYGELVKTVTLTVGDSFDLIKLDNIKSDDVSHYGWTKTAGSETRNYAPETTIYPTSDMDLYAVFYYKYSAGTIVGTKSIGTQASTTYSGTIEVSGTMTFYGSYTTVTNTSNGVTTPSYISGSYSLYINGTKVDGSGSLSGGDTRSYSVSAGNSYKVVVGSYNISSFTIPAYVQDIKYAYRSDV